MNVESHGGRHERLRPLYDMGSPKDAVRRREVGVTEGMRAYPHLDDLLAGREVRPRGKPEADDGERAKGEGAQQHPRSCTAPS